VGKGSGRRPSLISRKREDLQWLLSEKKISFKEYERRRKKLIEQRYGIQRDKMRPSKYRCPQQVTREEENLRCLLLQKRITFKQYECKRRKLMKQGLWGQRKPRFKLQ